MGEVLMVRRLHSIWQSAQGSKKHPRFFLERIHAPADSFISKNEGMNEYLTTNPLALYQLFNKGRGSDRTPRG